MPSLDLSALWPDQQTVITWPVAAQLDWLSGHDINVRVWELHARTSSLAHPHPFVRHGRRRGSLRQQYALQPFEARGLFRPAAI